MAGPYREKVFALAAKLETTSGTDATPTVASNALRVVGIPTLTVNDLETGDRSDVEWGGLGVIDQAPPAGTYGTIDLQMEVMGAGAAYAASVAPPMDVLLQGAGFSSVGSFTAGAEKYTYTTLDTGMKTFTLYCWTGDKLFKLVGCVAAPKLEAEAAKRGMMTFSVTGKVLSIADNTFGAVTVNATVPPLFHSSTASIGVWTSTDASEPLVVKKASIDFGTTVVDRPSAGATDGLIGYLITDRKVQHMMTVERVSGAKFDPDAIAKAASIGTNTKASWQIGTAQYNRMKIATGQWLLKRPARGSANGLLTWDLAGPLKAGSETASGREIQLIFD